MTDQIKELIDYIMEIRDESRFLLYENAGSEKDENVHRRLHARGVNIACKQILDKVDKLFEDENSRIAKIREYVDKLREEAIQDAVHCSRTRNYEGLARAYERENVCEDIEDEIRRILEG